MQSKRHDEPSERFFGCAIDKTQADDDNIIKTEGRVPVNRSSVNRQFP